MKQVSDTLTVYKVFIFYNLIFYSIHVILISIRNETEAKKYFAVKVFHSTQSLKEQASTALRMGMKGVFILINLIILKKNASFNDNFLDLFRHTSKKLTETLSVCTIYCYS